MRIYQPLDLEKRQFYWRNGRVPLCALALVAIAFGFPAWRAVPAARDVAGRPALTAPATVVSEIEAPATRARLVPREMVVKSFAGTKISTYSRFPARPGERVELSYRLGRSGNIYTYGFSLAVPSFLGRLRSIPGETGTSSPALSRRESR